MLLRHARRQRTRDGLACAGELPQRVGPLVPRLLMNMTGVAKEAGLRLGEVTQFTAPSSPLICVSQLSFRMAPLFQATTETCPCSANLKTLFRFLLKEMFVCLKRSCPLHSSNDLSQAKLVARKHAAAQVCCGVIWLQQRPIAVPGPRGRF